MLRKIKDFLSHKITTLLIPLVVIVGRIIQLIFLFNIRADRSHQMLATYSLVNGHGVSKAFALPGDLSATIYEPLVNWPSGYSFLLAPFYSLFNHNYIVAGLVIDILCTIALVYCCRYILKILSIPVYLINLYTLLTGFVLYAFYIKSSTDAIAISFFLLGFACCLQLLKSDNNSWWLKTIGLIISLSVCASMKFMYIPVVLILPLFLVLRGFVGKKMLLKKAGIVALLFLSVALAALIIYQKNISGSVAHIAQSSSGIFSENLLSSYPFVPVSIINPETVGLFTKQAYEGGSLIYKSFQIIHILLSLLLLYGGLRMVFKKGIKNISLANSFFYLTLLLSLAITALLAFLSFTTAKELGFWTYVQEARYFGLPIILLQLSVFIFYHHYPSQKKIFATYLPLFFLLLFLPDMFRGIAFSINRVKNFKKEEYSWQVDYHFQQFAAAIIKKEQAEKGIFPIVLTGSSPYMNNRVALYSHVPVMKEIEKINDLRSLNTKSSVLLLVVLREDAVQDFASFLSSTEKKEAGQFGGFHFYTIYVTPH